MMPDRTGETFGSEASRIAALDWQTIGDELDREGYAVLSDVLRPSEVMAIGRLLADEEGQVGALAEQGLGQGRYRAFRAPLPATLPLWQRALRAGLSPLANRWETLLERSVTHVPRPREVAVHAGSGGDVVATLTHLGSGDFYALHQDLEAGVSFPFQAALLLSDHGRFSGGELVLTEQRPRMQSRPMVVPVQPGDIAILAAVHRPHKGAKGYYKVTLKHGISRVRRGERLGLELLLGP